jgi:cytochrome P450
MSVSIDFSDPAIQADPYSVYAELRRDNPVVWNERTWLISRYGDITTLLSDPRMSSARTDQTFAVLPPEVQAEMTPMRTIMTSRMLLSDPPKHTRLKNIVNKAFTPRMIESRRGRIEQICHTFLDRVAAQGRMDVMEDIASPLPGWAIADILGIPADEQGFFTRWARDQVRVYDRAGVSPADRVAVMRQGQASMLEMRAHLEGIINARREEPRDDLISELLQAESEGDRLSQDELFAMCVALLVGGNNSTAHLIGNAVLTLIRHPEALAQILADPALIRPAVEEVMRYESRRPAGSSRRRWSSRDSTSRRGRGSWSSSARPTATPTSSPLPTASTSPVSRTATSPSRTGRTSAWGRRSRARWRKSASSRRSSAAPT